jgi:hypothetical protein
VIFQLRGAPFFSTPPTLLLLSLGNHYLSSLVWYNTPNLTVNDLLLLITTILGSALIINTILDLALIITTILDSQFGVDYYYYDSWFNIYNYFDSRFGFDIGYVCLVAYLIQYRNSQ